MSNNKLPEKLVHYILSVLPLLVAINAFARFYGMADAKSVPTECDNRKKCDGHD
jgi:hypothetical protein